MRILTLTGLLVTAACQAVIVSQPCSLSSVRMLKLKFSKAIIFNDFRRLPTAPWLGLYGTQKFSYRRVTHWKLSSIIALSQLRVINIMAPCDNPHTSAKPTCGFRRCSEMNPVTPLSLLMHAVTGRYSPPPTGCKNRPNNPYVMQIKARSLN